MTDEQKREHAEAIKHALGMASPEFGPPMEGEEGWVDPRPYRADPDYHSPDDGRGPRRVFVDGTEVHKVIAAHVSGGFVRVAEDSAAPGGVGRYVTGKVEVVPMTVEDAEDEDWDMLYGDVERTAKERAENAQAVIDAIREAKERRLADERAKAAEPAPPSNDPWAVIGKAEDDGDRIMDITRNFG